jgi:hypothetical protein
VYGTNNASYTGTTGPIAAHALASTGTGYTVGDVLTIAGGSSGTITVSSVSSGVITGYTLSNPGTGYSVSTQSLSGGTGSGATLSILRLADAAGTLLQAVGAVNGSTYYVTYTVTRSAGELLVTIGGVAGHRVRAAGTYIQAITATGAGALTFTPTTDFTGTVDTVSVQLMTLADTPVALADSGGTTRVTMRPASGTQVVFGLNAGRSSTTGTGWTAIGLDAGRSSTTGLGWTAIGLDAGRFNTTGELWTAIGINAGRSSTIGSNWMAIGANAGTSNTTGGGWIAIGLGAGRLNTTGSSWTAIGFDAGRANTTGGSWTAIGNSSFSDGGVSPLSIKRSA